MTASSPEDYADISMMSMDHLINEFAGWNSILDTDDYDLIAKTKALYRFAMNNYHAPGSELLLQALQAFEDARDDRDQR
ncbi:hypothetical protein [Mycolicibacterium sp.]|uniref:hypothetical protein n=1 Tax=Mycolicibacterium sp. TaxID=2320850 RepID=UPI0037CA61FB